MVASLQRIQKLGKSLDQTVEDTRRKMPHGNHQEFEDMLIKRREFLADKLGQMLKEEFPLFISDPLTFAHRVVMLALGDAEESSKDIVNVLEGNKPVARIVEDFFSALIYGEINTLSSRYRELYTEENADAIYSVLRQSKHKIERYWRGWQLCDPTSEEEFHSALNWMICEGNRKDLILIKAVRKEPAYRSEHTIELLEMAEKEIEERTRNWQYQEPVKYQIFCPEEETSLFPPQVTVIRKYNAFTVVEADEEIIQTLRERWSITKLDWNNLARYHTMAEQKTGFTQPQDAAIEQDEKSPQTMSVPNKVMRETVIVNFRTPVMESWKKEIERVGGRILQTLSGHSLAVDVPNTIVLNEILSMNDVSGVDNYTPVIRVRRDALEDMVRELSMPEDEEDEDDYDNAAPDMIEDWPRNPFYESQELSFPGILIATFFKQDYRENASIELGKKGIVILEMPGDLMIVIDLTSNNDALGAFDMISKLHGLCSLEEKTMAVPFMDKAREASGREVVTNNTQWTGRGEIIAIADTGIDTGEKSTMHPDLRRRVKAIKSYKVQADSRYTNVGDDDGASDKYSGHGTHVAGIAVGNGSGATKYKDLPQVKGMAPEASLVFQAVEQTLKRVPLPKKNKKILPVSGMAGLPYDLKDLFEYAYSEGARIHSNSWGAIDSQSLGQYTTRSWQLDDFVWKKRNFLVVVAAGNSARQSANDPNSITQGNVVPPGTAKNCLTVGACENDRPGISSITYSEYAPFSFPLPPYSARKMAQSIDEIALFSSRGPCCTSRAWPDCRDYCPQTGGKGTDCRGRQKPDVVAPGTLILSTRSGMIPFNNFGERTCLPNYGSYMYMSGTSMATPIVAGSAALVRQYLREERNIDDPSAALVKAAIIHSAKYIPQHKSSHLQADTVQGWGRIDLDEILCPARSVEVHFFEETDGFKNNDYTRVYTVEVKTAEAETAEGEIACIPLRATLCYTDYPGEKLINTINLRLCSPGGKKYEHFDGINNIKKISVPCPETGVWRIEVVPGSITESPQDFALVISGGDLTPPKRIKSKRR